MLAASGPSSAPLGLRSPRSTESWPLCKQPDPKGRERKQTAKRFQKAARALDLAVAITHFSPAKPSPSFLKSHYPLTRNGRPGRAVLQPIALIRLQEKYIKQPLHSLYTLTRFLRTSHQSISGKSSHFTPPMDSGNGFPTSPGTPRRPGQRTTSRLPEGPQEPHTAASAPRRRGTASRCAVTDSDLKKAALISIYLEPSFKLPSEKSITHEIFFFSFQEHKSGGGGESRKEKASWWVQHLCVLKALHVLCMRMLPPLQRFLRESTRQGLYSLLLGSPFFSKIYFNSTI